MPRPSVDDSLMQPDPAEDDAAPAAMPLGPPLPVLTDVPDIPVPSTWREPMRQRQARRDAWRGLQELAAMIEPVTSAQSGVDIELDLAVGSVDPATRPADEKALAVSQSTQKPLFSWFDAPSLEVTSCKIRTGRSIGGSVMQGSGQVYSPPWSGSPLGLGLREEAVNDAFRASALPAMNEHLNDVGARLLQSIPVAVRPLITAKRHPHVINKMAVLWEDPKDLSRYFGELLLSSRPGRRGFAIEVLDELVCLQRALQERHRI